MRDVNLQTTKSYAGGNLGELKAIQCDKNIS